MLDLTEWLPRTPGVALLVLVMERVRFFEAISGVRCCFLRHRETGNKNTAMADGAKCYLCQVLKANVWDWSDC